MGVSGGTRNFFVGGNKGAKCNSEGAKIQTFAENGWFWPFFLLTGVQVGGAEPPTGGHLPPMPPWCRHWCECPPPPVKMCKSSFHILWQPSFHPGGCDNRSLKPLITSIIWVVCTPPFNMSDVNINETVVVCTLNRTLRMSKIQWNLINTSKSD